jgi:hypothetical protein
VVGRKQRQVRVHEMRKRIRSEGEWWVRGEGGEKT